MHTPEVNTNIHQTPLQIFLRFLRFGLLAWGGPTAQIAMIRRELVEEEKWMTSEKFNRVLAVYQALPGPEAHELCVYFGMLAGGRRGAVLAGLGFMLPGLVLMLLLTALYASFGLHDPGARAVFVGVQAAVVALILTAVPRIGRHILRDRPLWAIAGAAGLCFALGVHFLLILGAAGAAYALYMKDRRVIAIVLGIALTGWAIFNFSPEISHMSTQNEAMANGFQQGNPLQLLGTGLKGGLLSFGGAYTVIPIMQQEAVAEQAWMTQRQFLDGIAISGILPAPLIIFTTFIGWFGAGWLGAIAITAGIFLPAFAFTLIGHSLMERLIAYPPLHHFLDGIGAGVTGLIAVTALQLLAATLNDWFSLLVCAAALAVLHWYKSKYTVIFVVFGAAMAAAVRYAIG